MNIAILRRPEQVERIRIYPGTSDPAAVSVKYLNDQERQQVAEIAERLISEGRDREDAHRIAFGRVAVKGFEGIFDGETEMSFTDENVDFLMLHARDFRTVVLTAATTLQRAVEKN